SEPGLRDADDHIARAVEQHRLADHAGLPAEAPPPTIVADDDHWMRALSAIVLVPNDAALRRRHAERVEVIARNQLDVDLVGLFTRAELDGVRHREREQIAEDLVLIAVIHEIGIGEDVAQKLRIDSLARDEREPMRIFHRQWAQQQLVRHAEDRRVSANAERQRDYSNQGEAWVL